MKWSMVSIAIIFAIFIQTEGLERSTFTCGRRIPPHNRLITKGFSSNEHWPWHAAIYHARKSQDATTEPQDDGYACGGTLIASNAILTAAHCVCNYNDPIDPKNVIIKLGKLNLDVDETISSQSFEALSIIQHPNYSSIDLNNDIAIIRLPIEATFNNYVQPICLWDSTKVELSEVIGKYGTVIGWGFTETNNLSHVLQEAVMPVVSSWMCLASHRDFFGAYLTERNFCAGFRNGTSVCNGDSGGSMTFEEKGVFYIRGIVSVSQARKSVQHRMLCDPNEYVLFTDVAKYLPWIQEVTKQFISECEKKVQCLPYELHEDSGGLKCKINIDITLAERNCKIIFEDSPNKNVTVLTIFGRLEALPDLTDAFEKFENIVYIDVGFTKMSFVERNKLTIIKKITWLSFYGNRLNEIGADTFDDLSKIEKLLLADNRLRIIHRDVFKELHKLKEIWLQKNQLEILPEGLFRNNLELENIFVGENSLKTVATDFGNLPKLIAIDFRDNDCINEWCDVATFCGTSSKEEMRTKIWNKC